MRLLAAASLLAALAGPLASQQSSSLIMRKGGPAYPFCTYAYDLLATGTPAASLFAYLASVRDSGSFAPPAAQDTTATREDLEAILPGFDMADMSATSREYIASQYDTAARRSVASLAARYNIALPTPAVVVGARRLYERLAVHDASFADSMKRAVDIKNEKPIAVYFWSDTIFASTLTMETGSVETVIHEFVHAMQQRGLLDSLAHAQHGLDQLRVEAIASYLAHRETAKLSFPSAPDSSLDATVFTTLARKLRMARSFRTEPLDEDTYWGWAFYIAAPAFIALDATTHGPDAAMNRFLNLPPCF